MIEVKGKYNNAKIFTDHMDEETLAQILNLLNQQFVSGSQIRIMPDCHAGKGCTIGTTMTLSGKAVPNLVGVDIGCGMETVLLGDRRVELQKLDTLIREAIPAGFDIRATTHAIANEMDITRLRCAKSVNLNRAELSLGTLGGGNHFIELDRDDEGCCYLVVHSGSRHLGKQVAEYYQNAAAKELETLQQQGSIKLDKNLAFVQGRLFDDYIHDMTLTQHYALLNRRAIVMDIVKRMKFKVEDHFTTIHNYIETDTMILRKGAISAKAGEQVLIPMNMRDGSLICIGKGNADWNYSAPHGAGRLMSRSAAKGSITLSQFKEAMKGIYSSTINKSTIDESPFAYKPMDEIIANIADTVDIVKHIKPIYNFKAAEQGGKMR